jgi:hypothetical protein
MPCICAIAGVVNNPTIMTAIIFFTILSSSPRIVNTRERAITLASLR